MPSAFIFSLPKSARLAYPTVLAGVNRGLSIRAQHRILQSAGIRIDRTTTLTSLVRKVEQFAKQGRTIKNIPKGQTINVRRLPQALTGQRREYSYIVRIRGTDAAGNPIDRFTTVATDSDRLSVNDIESLAEELVSAQGQSATVLTVSATLESGSQKSNPLMRF